MNPRIASTASFAPARARDVAAPLRGRRAGFTLVEMVVVVGIVLVLLGIALPSVNTMWAQHRESNASNAISGMLMSTRAKAIQGDRGEVGMFFYLDAKGVQQIALITRDPRIETDRQATPPITAPLWRTDSAWRDVFTVAEEGGQALLAPMRAVPRYIVDDPNSGEPTKSFSPIELGNEDFNNSLALVLDNVQRHRNFFAVIFLPDGELDVGRDVLIRDPDADEDDVGDITGLAVSDTADKYYGFDKDNSKPDFKLVTNWAANASPALALTVDAIVAADDLGVAVNFPSVDGVMVYDDSALQTGGNELEKRQTLLEIARPYYIHRLSGAVVRGPVGEVPPEEQTSP